MGGSSFGRVAAGVCQDVQRHWPTLSPAVATAQESAFDGLLQRAQ